MNDDKTATEVDNERYKVLMEEILEASNKINRMTSGPNYILSQSVQRVNNCQYCDAARCVISEITHPIDFFFLVFTKELWLSLEANPSRKLQINYPSCNVKLFLNDILIKEYIPNGRMILSYFEDSEVINSDSCDSISKAAMSIAQYVNSPATPNTRDYVLDNLATHEIEFNYDGGLDD